MEKAVQTRQRWLWLAALAGFLGVLYVGSYLYLSRRGIAEATQLGASYFFYCPIDDLVPYQDLPPQHCWAVAVFDPINHLDRAWFGGGIPCRGVTWGFSRPTQ